MCIIYKCTNIFKKKEDLSIDNLSFHFRKLENEDQYKPESYQKEIIIPEINETECLLHWLGGHRKINETKS